MALSNLSLGKTFINSLVGRSVELSVSVWNTRRCYWWGRDLL